ncbi:MAG: SAM-dependent methyltransferase [Clostridia bacterium]|nr:MAG: SAM-dependent methyltransferase [Clostridia bacterium]
MRQCNRKLPSAGPEREALREKGQFWTPEWVAEAMVAYALAGGADHIFDPAVGGGAFFLAAKVLARETGKGIKLLGTEVDPDALRQARQSGLSEGDLSHVQIADFVLDPPRGLFKAIVANPPYIRHHRVPTLVKEKLKAIGTSIVGMALDGRAGIHVYFLLRALQLLDRGGRLAFIMPADTCEGVFAPHLWNWITGRFRLEVVVTFAPEATPFPGVDTNPLIFMITNAEPQDHFLWVKCNDANTMELKKWIMSGNKVTTNSALTVYERRLTEGLATGLSRPPAEKQAGGPVLGDFARVLRGVATGANEFFFLTRQQATDLGIPDEFLVPAVGRTRDVPGHEITPETLRRLEEIGRPTLLFSPDGRAMDSFPEAVRSYLKHGEKMGFNQRPLIATRRPWYKMERRPVPPILFAYLGRRNARFIRNLANVVPLTGFLCVYPNRGEAIFTDKLWEVLRHPVTTSNLSLVSKSYGEGAIKVEPRALERLPLPPAVVAEVGLEPVQAPALAKALDICKATAPRQLRVFYP